MKISFAPYELMPRSRSLNARVAEGTEPKGRSGTLLRIETSEGTGYADLHPWTEFGDLPLSQELEVLKTGRHTKLSQRSLYFAELDLKLRSEKRSAFEGLIIPRSHFLLPGPIAAGPDLLGALDHDDFHSVKIKCGRNMGAELQQFTHLAHHWPEDFRLRLDFNASLSAQAAKDYLSRFPRGMRARIEFVEDPCAFEVAAWKAISSETPIGLALDLEATNPLRIKSAVEQNCISHLVVKPAVQNANELLQLVDSAGGKDIRFSFTSYMDHPLGQVTAAWTAAKFLNDHPGRISDCGLLSHTVYEPNDFSDELVVEGPSLQAPEGTGFGFDQLLSRQKWQVLA